MSEPMQVDDNNVQIPLLPPPASSPPVSNPPSVPNDGNTTSSSGYIIDISAAEDAFAQHTKDLKVPENIKDWIDTADLQYSTKKSHVEYFNNLASAVKRSDMNRYLKVMMNHILVINRKEDLYPLGENFNYLAIKCKNRVINNPSLLSNLLTIAEATVAKLLTATNFGALKKEVKDVDGESTLSPQTRELLTYCGFDSDVTSLEVPIIVLVFISRTSAGYDLTTKLHDTVGVIENLYLAKDLHKKYGNLDKLSGDVAFVDDFRNHVSDTVAQLGAPTLHLAILTWIKYFAHRFIGSSKSAFLCLMIPELNRCKTSNEPFNEQVIKEFLHKITMSKNRTLLKYTPPLSITEMDLDDVSPSSETTKAMNQGAKRSQGGSNGPNSLNQSSSRKKSKKSDAENTQYVFQTRGPGIKFTLPKGWGVSKNCIFCETCGVIEKKGEHTFLNNKYTELAHTIDAIVEQQAFPISITSENHKIFNHKTKDKIFLMDSGASVTVLNDKSMIENYRESPAIIRVAGGLKVMARGRGYFQFNGQYLECLYVPQNKTNIISIHQLHLAGYGVFSTLTHMFLLRLRKVPDKLRESFITFMKEEHTKMRTTILPYIKEGGMPYVRLDGKLEVDEVEYLEVDDHANECTHLDHCRDETFSPCNHSSDDSNREETDMTKLTNTSKIKIPIYSVSKLDFSQIDTTLSQVPADGVFRIHCALGHMHWKKLKELGIILSKGQIKRIKRCKTCKVGKFTTKPTTQHKDRTSTAPFQHLHMDTAGPIRALGKPWYVVLLIDDFSRYLKVFVVRKKSDVKTEVERYLESEKNVRGYYPRYITTDKGSEFSELGFEITRDWDNNARQDLHLSDVPYLNVAPTGNKEYNGLAERTVRTLKTLESLIVSHVSEYAREKYLKLAFMYAAELYNRSPHTGIDNEYPYGKYFKRKPKLYTEDEKADKQEYLNAQPAHTFLNIKRTLPELPMFLEDGCIPVIQKGITVLEECYFVGYDSNDCILVMRKPKNGRVHEFLDKTTQFTRFGTFELHMGGKTKGVAEMYEQYSCEVPFTQEDAILLRALVSSNSENEIIVNSLELGEPDEPQIIPKNFKDALAREEWRKAIEKEIQSFLSQGVYKSSTRVQNATYLHTFWIFTRKLNGKAKARLITINPKTVGKRDKQASSPVVQQSTISMMFVLFTMRTGLSFSVYDISTAFLNSIVPPDEIYLLRTPLGFGTHFNTKFVQMLKYCYGLNVSPLKFHQTLCAAFGEDFPDSPYDRCFHRNLDKDVMVAHHVDDLLVLSKDPQELVQKLQDAKFDITSSTKPDAYLGCDLHQSEAGISVSLCTYLEKAVKNLPSVLQQEITTHSIKPFTGEANFNVHPPPQPTEEYLKPLIEAGEDENPQLPLPDIVNSYELDPLDSDSIYLPKVTAPTTEQKQTNKNNGSHKASKRSPVDMEFSVTMYRSLVGILNYVATKGRIDIQVYTSILAQYSHMPTLHEYKQAIQLLKYCYSTRKSGCYYQRATREIDRNSEITIDVYTDASDRKDASQGGYIILVNGFYVKSKSYRLSHFTASSYEAELLALRVGVVQGLCLIPCLRSLGYKKIKIEAHCDNLPVIQRILEIAPGDGTYKLVYSNCLTALRWYKRHSRVTFNHISGEINPADIFTKPMDFWKLSKLLHSPILKKTFKLLIQTKKEKINTVSSIIIPDVYTKRN